MHVTALAVGKFTEDQKDKKALTRQGYKCEQWELESRMGSAWE